MTEKEFAANRSIALKEASETAYWLEILFETGYSQKKAFGSIVIDCRELIRLLVATVKTSRNAVWMADNG